MTSPCPVCGAAAARPLTVAVRTNASSHTMNVRARLKSDMSVDVPKRTVILVHLTRKRRCLDLPQRCRPTLSSIRRRCNRSAQNALLVRQRSRGWSGLIATTPHMRSLGVSTIGPSEPPSDPDPQGALFVRVRLKPDATTSAAAPELKRVPDVPSGRLLDLCEQRGEDLRVALVGV